MFIDGAPFEKGRIDKHLLEVGSKTFLEGFEDKLIGHKKGDTVEISIRYADTDQRKEFAGKEVLFRTNIKEVKRRYCRTLMMSLQRMLAVLPILKNLRKG